MKKKTKRLIRDSLFSTLLSCVLVAILMLTVKNLTFFNPFVQSLTDFSLHDLYYSQNFKPQEKINKDIVLINAERLERDMLAVLIEKVAEQNPKVIGLDIIFEDLKEFYADSLLAKTLQAKTIVNAFEVKGDDLLDNHPVFSNENPKGFTNFNFRDENYNYVIRKFQGIHEERKDFISFAGQVSKQFLNEQTWADYEYDVKLRKERIIKFYGNLDLFLNLSIDDFTDYGKVSFLKDKIAIIGYFGEQGRRMFDIEDKFFTPLNQFPVGKGDKDMYGCVLHANIINMLINNDFIFEISMFWILLYTFISMYFTTMLLIKLDKKSRTRYRISKNGYLFVHSLVMVGLALILYRYNIVLDVAPIIIGTLFAASFVKFYKDLIRYLKKNLKWKFKTYVK